MAKLQKCAKSLKHKGFKCLWLALAKGSYPKKNQLRFGHCPKGGGG